MVTSALCAQTPAPPEAEPPARAGAPPTLASRLTQLDEAPQAGLITEDEYQARRQAVLDSV